MTQDKETLREAKYFRQHVAVDIEIAVYEKTGLQLTDKQGEAAADAAIATMFERLRTPSEGMDKAARRVPWLTNISPDYKGIWQAMLTAFQQENSDER